MDIAPISSSHDTSKFKCGHNSLDYYLKKYAHSNTLDHISTTYVSADENNCVLGYYSICTGAISASDVPGDRFPYPQLGIILLARWAVDKRSQGQGIGKRLFYDALRRSANMAKEVAAVALVVDAIDEDAHDGYIKYGFQETLSDRMKLFLPMSDIIALNL